MGVPIFLISFFVGLEVHFSWHLTERPIFSYLAFTVLGFARFCVAPAARVSQGGLGDCTGDDTTIQTTPARSQRTVPDVHGDNGAHEFCHHYAAQEVL
ncbi:hypothetical protein H4582DRAFT_1264936 [Lactarius indigo]|nr:hypothetical protein H4582DRAFT_1264936 [Lactarius indigo]